MIVELWDRMKGYDEFLEKATRPGDAGARHRAGDRDRHPALHNLFGPRFEEIPGLLPLPAGRRVPARAWRVAEPCVVARRLREPSKAAAQPLQRSKEREKTKYENRRKRGAQSATKNAAKRADGESAVLAAIAAMPRPDRAMGERLHAVIKASAPALSPKTWYGMPAYAKDGMVLCFFRSGQKFKERYMTLGFNDKANLDKGALWPISFALKELTAAEEAKIAALVQKAVR